MSSQPVGADLQSQYERARLVKKANESRLMAKANVIGVGIGMEPGGIILVVLVSRKPDTITSDWIPAEIEGIRIDVRVVGNITAQ